MRINSGLLLVGAVLAAGSLPAATIQFDVTGLGPNSSRYNYFVSGITFQANQELDIRFDPARYSNLSNPMAGGGFNATVLQPNNPPGVFGDYSALALTNNPSLAGPFSVDFSFSGAGQPGPQPYSINQFDQSGNFVSTLETGVTSPRVITGVPEPASVTLCGIAVLFIGFMWIFRRARDFQLLRPDFHSGGRQ